MSDIVQRYMDEAVGVKTLLRFCPEDQWASIIATALAEAEQRVREEERERAADIAANLPMSTDGAKYSPGTEQTCFEAGQDDASRAIAAAIRQPSTGDER